MEQTDTDQRGGGKGIMVERRGRNYSKNMYEQSMDMENRVWTDCGSGGGLGGGEQRGKNWDNCKRTKIIFF